MGSLEVVSKETFQQQLEGMSSCAGCRKERLKEVATRKLTRRSRKGSHIKSNSPIVVHLRDTIRASAKGKLREAMASSDVESEIDSSDECSTASPHSTSSSSHHGSTSSTPPESPRDRSGRRPKGLRISRMRRARKDGKNFNAFLSAIEKVHSKDRGFHLINNLSHQYNWHSKEHKNGFVPHGDLLLNNVVAAAYQNSITNSFLRGVSGTGSPTQFPPQTYHHICSKPKAFDSINRDKVDLICNDLSSESYESVTSIDDSENASVISSTDSLCESDGSSPDVVGEELTKEELEKLAEFTTGCPLKRYSCPPHECPECLAAYYAYTQYCAQENDLLKIEIVDKADGATEDGDGSAAKGAPEHENVLRGNSSTNSREQTPVSSSPSESEAESVDIKPKRVEISVASFFEKPARRPYGGHSNKQPDTVTIDITDSDVTFTVSYPPGPGETINPEADPDSQGYGQVAPWPSYYDFYNNFYQTMLGFMPFLIPAYWVPPFYPPWSYPPMVVPRPMSFKECNAAFKDANKCLSSNRGTQTQDNRPFTATAPPQRPWIPLAHPDTNKSVAIFTVMCYNVLCDKYATRQLYGYCPSWALNWEYRKKIIIEEIRQYSADIISLQEVETDQFYNYFLPELKQNGYDGVFAPKSRARTMAEVDRKHVDGCAIFFQTEKFKLVKDYLVEFNQLAISTADGSHDMINRVMTKDNIGLAALLETKSSVWENGLPAEDQIRQHILVSTCHVHWDPEFCDVKLIQTMMLMSELKNIIQDTQTSLRPGSTAPDVNRVPLILCGDLNSLPESGVVDFLNVGRVSAKHEDFKGLGYEDCLRKLSISENKDMYTHGFKLSQAYDNEIMPYTNYTYDFKGIIDYIFYSRDFMRPLGLLGPLDQEWFKENKVFGCPHPQIPSDHLPLLTEFEMTAQHSLNIGAADNSRRNNTVATRR